MRQLEKLTGWVAAELIAAQLADRGASPVVLRRLYTQGWSWPDPACAPHRTKETQKRPAPTASGNPPRGRSNKAQRTAPPLVRVTFDGTGPLGLSFRKDSRPPVLSSIREGSLAAAMAPPLKPGLVLKMIGGQDIAPASSPRQKGGARAGFATFPEAMLLLKKATRPLELAFAVPSATSPRLSTSPKPAG